MLCAQRLKFTVVSEPMDEDGECVDVGHAFLDLKELLLTGNDVTEQQIHSGCRTRDAMILRMQTASAEALNKPTLFVPVVSLDPDKEVLGHLKVSLEAAEALTGIYREFRQRSARREEEDVSGDEEEEKDEKQKESEEIMQLIDCDSDLE